jgi:choline dehydrogenase
MDYIRGEKAQFDAWEALGNEGWNWDTLFPYYILSENFTIPTTAQFAAGVTDEKLYHGESGHLKTGFPYQLENDSFHNIAQQTFGKLGLPLNLDLNGGNTRGFGAYPQTLDRDADVRESSARAYYQPVEHRPNLQIIKGTVKRVTWSDSDHSELTATGVEYFDASGDLVNITAKKEVILSAGTYRSPLILELSGVGSPRYVHITDDEEIDTDWPSVLAKNGIDTKLELPGVGEGFQDQPLITLVYESTINFTGHIPFVGFATAQDIFGNNTAALAASTSANLSSWAQAVSARLNGSVSPKALEKRFQIQHDVIFNKQATITELMFFTEGTIAGIAFWSLTPFSWGSVHLDSPDTINDPALDPNFLSIDYDLQTLIGAGRLSQKVWNTQPLSSLAIANIIPGDAALPLNATDADWSAVITSSGKLFIYAAF